jgi:hypothetical protein
MADIFTQVTVQPEIPAAIIQKKELELLERFLSHEEVIDRNGEKTLYFFSREYSGFATDEDGKSINDNVMADAFKGIIKRSKGRLEYVYVHAACTCSKMQPDEFGGWIMFIRKDSVKRFSTWQAIERLRTKGKI